MTEETYNHICQIHHNLLESESPLAERFKIHSTLYWKLRSQLTQEQWQTVNDCFCSFHSFYMAVLAVALNDTP